MRRGLEWPLVVTEVPYLNENNLVQLMFHNLSLCHQTVDNLWYPSQTKNKHSLHLRSMLLGRWCMKWWKEMCQLGCCCRCSSHCDEAEIHKIKLSFEHKHSAQSRNNKSINYQFRSYSHEKVCHDFNQSINPYPAVVAWW